MAIEGTPAIMVKTGELAEIDLGAYCSPHGTYIPDIDDASKSALGIIEDPVVTDGVLKVRCNNTGAGKITLSASVGKDPEREDGIGGMPYTREISLVSRSFVAGNGGWL